MDYQRLVKELRNKLILSQQEFAGLLNVSFASINRWETGNIGNICKEKENVEKNVKRGGNYITLFKLQLIKLSSNY